MTNEDSPCSAADTLPPWQSQGSLPPLKGTQCLVLSKTLKPGKGLAEGAALCPPLYQCTQGPISHAWYQNWNQEYKQFLIPNKTKTLTLMWSWSAVTSQGWCTCQNMKTGPTSWCLYKESEISLLNLHTCMQWHTVTIPPDTWSIHLIHHDFLKWIH